MTNDTIQHENGDGHESESDDEHVRINPLTREYEFSEVSQILSDFMIRNSEFRTVSRISAIKTVTKYIKQHGLQQENDKRIIILDTTLKTLFSTNEDTVTYAAIMTKLGPHFRPHA